MKRSLLLGIAVLALTTVAAEARDGCGSGMFFNGRGCVPQGGFYGGYGGYGGYRQYDPYEARRTRDNVVQPRRDRSGTISCGNPNYTWQSGACRPYTGPR